MPWRTRLDTFLKIIKISKNPLQIIRSMKKSKYPIKVILKNGQIKLCEHPIIFHALINNCKNLEIKNETLILNEENIQFVDWQTNGDIPGVFIMKEYDKIPVKHADVIDIGANIGDTAIRFIQNGANTVIGIEPVPKFCISAKKNIVLNKMEDKIKIINCLVGRENRTIRTKFKIDEEIGSSALAIPDKYGEEIESKTLEHLISLTNSPSKILKLDCEGCEYDIILNTPIDTLKKFQYIFVEYHDGYKNLERKLTKCGFSVKNNTQNIYHRKHTNSILYLGYLIATK